LGGPGGGSAPHLELANGSAKFANRFASGPGFIEQINPALAQPVFCPQPKSVCASGNQTFENQFITTKTANIILSWCIFGELPIGAI